MEDMKGMEDRVVAEFWLLEAMEGRRLCRRGKEYLKAEAKKVVKGIEVVKIMEG
jgi:hypothetical protein